ncbi:MAG: hypothetical protein R3D90_05265 [Paracoccaceae bacterium]
MFATLKSLACAAAASLFLIGGAQAATVNFTIDSVGLGTETCNPVGRNDTNCNFSIGSQLGVTSSTITTPATQTFRLFNIVANGDDQGLADSFSFMTTVEILVGVARYEFSALANIVNWNPESTNNLNSGARLTWGPVTSTLGAPLIVTFLPGLPFRPLGPDYIRADIRIEAVSVVPLPGGVLLLLSAIAGLFGLSRRRRQIAA